MHSQHFCNLNVRDLETSASLGLSGQQVQPHVLAPVQLKTKWTWGVSLVSKRDCCVKCENLSWKAQHLCKKLGMAVHVYNLAQWRQEDCCVVQAASIAAGSERDPVYSGNLFKGIR